MSLFFTSTLRCDDGGGGVWTCIDNGNVGCPTVLGNRQNSFRGSASTDLNAAIDSANRNGAANCQQLQADAQRELQAQKDREAQEAAIRARDAAIAAELEKQRLAEERRLAEQQAINEANAAREAELLRQNEEQNKRLAETSALAVNNTIDFAESEGKRLSLFASESIDKTASTTQNAVKQTADTAGVALASIVGANEQIFLLGLLGFGAFMIYKNKNKILKGIK